MFYNVTTSKEDDFWFTLPHAVRKMLFHSKRSKVCNDSSLAQVYITLRYKLTLCKIQSEYIFFDPLLFSFNERRIVIQFSSYNITVRRYSFSFSKILEPISLVQEQRNGSKISIRQVWNRDFTTHHVNLPLWKWSWCTNTKHLIWNRPLLKLLPDKLFYFCLSCLKW